MVPLFAMDSSYPRVRSVRNGWNGKGQRVGTVLLRQPRVSIMLAKVQNWSCGYFGGWVGGRIFIVFLFETTKKCTIGSQQSNDTEWKERQLTWWMLRKLYKSVNVRAGSSRRLNCWVFFRGCWICERKLTLAKTLTSSWAFGVPQNATAGTHRQDGGEASTTFPCYKIPRSNLMPLSLQFSGSCSDVLYLLSSRWTAVEAV